jgi:hypothetical protein
MGKNRQCSKSRYISWCWNSFYVILSWSLVQFSERCLFFWLLKSRLFSLHWIVIWSTESCLRKSDFKLTPVTYLLHIHERWFKHYGVDKHSFFVYRHWGDQQKRPRLRWEDNIKMDIRAVEWRGIDWIHLTQDRDQCKSIVKTVMIIRLS